MTRNALIEVLIFVEINKLKKEIEHCNQYKININKEIILIKKNIRIDCDSKISQLNIKTKSIEDDLKHKIDRLNKDLKEYKEEKTRIIKAHMVEKTEVEKLHKEKVHKIEIDNKWELDQLKKELNEERSKIKKCEEKLIQKLTKCQDEMSTTVKKYQEEILELKKRCSEDKTKFFDYRKEISEINKKYDNCQRDNLLVIKRYNEDKLKIEDQCKINILNIKNNFQIIKNKYQIKIDNLEKDKRKCFDDNFKDMERCKSEKIQIENNCKSEVINIKKQIQTSRDLSLKEISEISSKLKMCGLEKIYLNTIIENLKKTNKKYEINLENCNKEKESNVEKWKNQKKELELKIETCAREKQVITREIETEMNNLKRCKEDIKKIKEEDANKIKIIDKEKDAWEKKYQLCLLEKMQFKSTIEQKKIIIKNQESTIKTLNEQFNIKIENLKEKIRNSEIKLTRCEKEKNDLGSKINVSNTKDSEYTQKIIIIKKENEEKLEKCNSQQNNLNKLI